MIPTTSLYDVEDVEAFVAGHLTRSRIILADRDEHDELLAEGITILYELADRYQPHMPGYTHPGRFSGYAAQLLPRRMQDAYYRLHPEHQTRRVNGRKIREHSPAPLSIHQEAKYLSANGEHTNGHCGRDFADTIALATTAVDPTLHAHHHEHTDPTRLPLVASAMSLMAPQDRLNARPILGHMIDQMPTDQIAQQLGTTRGHVVRVRKAFEIAIRQAQQDALEAEAA